jgi:DHA1 family tetracycline resistance protein-like MFS transporter
VVLLPLVLAGGVLNTFIQSALTKSVERQEVGGILDIITSLEAVTRLTASSVGGILLKGLGIWAPGVFSALRVAFAVVFSYRSMVLPTRHHRLAVEVRE